MIKKIFGPFIAVVLLIFILSSCSFQQPLAIEDTDNNPTYEVHYLFKYENLEFYKFTDEGNEVYFSLPAQTITSVARDSTEKRVIMIGNSR